MPIGNFLPQNTTGIPASRGLGKAYPEELDELTSPNGRSWQSQYQGALTTRGYGESGPEGHPLQSLHRLNIHARYRQRVGAARW